MPATLTEANICDSVRAMLNDTAIQLFTNAVILPHTQVELGNLQAFVVQSGLPHLRTIGSVTKAATIVTPVDRTTNGFAEMVEPIQVFGRLTSSTNTWIEVPRVSDDLQFQNLLDAPTKPADNALGWKWADGVLQIGPSSTSRDYKILFYRNISPNPYTLTASYTFTDLVDFREYLCHRIASRLAMLISQNPSRAAALSEKADSLGLQIVGRMVKAEQFEPTRRRGFWSSRKRGTILA